MAQRHKIKNDNLDDFPTPPWDPLTKNHIALILGGTVTFTNFLNVAIGDRNI